MKIDPATGEAEQPQPKSEPKNQKKKRSSKAPKKTETDLALEGLALEPDFPDEEAAHLGSLKRKKPCRRTAPKDLSDFIVVDDFDSDVYEEFPSSPVLRTKKKRGAPSKNKTTPPVIEKLDLEKPTLEQTQRLDLTPIHDSHAHSMPDTPVSMSQQMTPRMDRLSDMVSPMHMDEPPNIITPEPEEEDIKPILNEAGGIVSLFDENNELDLEIESFVRNASVSKSDGVEQAAAAAREIENLGKSRIFIFKTC